MFKNSIKKISAVLLLVTLFTSVSVSARTTTVRTRATTTPAVTTPTVANIKDFGAHSIDEVGYSTFDSSIAINKAIQSAKNSGLKVVNFGSGRYYAKDISLESNITYSSTQGAELIASPDTQLWGSVISANSKTNIVIQGLTVNGNKKFVTGNDSQGSFLISFTTCSNITVSGCYLYNNWSLGILIQNNCNYVTIVNNEIYDTDCGIISANETSNNILIDGNTISGSPENQKSEPISIFNSNVKGLAHDITITNNIIHDKLEASAILVMNATKVLIKGNTAYNCYAGINVGLDGWMTGANVTTSDSITITENNVSNCGVGIVGELNNSLISRNTITNVKGMGIKLVTSNTKTLIKNDTILNNTITNINSAGTQEAAIKLDNTSNCTIDTNTVLDNRPTVLHWFVVQVGGSNSTDNIVQNNTNLGATTKNGYQIYVQDAKNTTVINNKGKILNQGTTSTLTSNIAA